MATKIIMLDIDGCLNTDSFLNSINIQAPLSIKEKQWLQNYPKLDKADIRNINKKHILYLNSIIKATGAKVVVSSDWRISSGPQQFQAMFNFHSFIGEVIGTTKVLNISRGLEIQDWLYDNDVDSFVIIDDRDDMEPFMDRLILCDKTKGLQQYHIDKAIKILNDSSSSNNSI